MVGGTLQVPRSEAINGSPKVGGTLRVPRLEALKDFFMNIIFKCYQCGNIFARGCNLKVVYTDTVSVRVPY